MSQLSEKKILAIRRANLIAADRDIDNDDPVVWAAWQVTFYYAEYAAGLENYFNGTGTWDAMRLARARLIKSLTWFLFCELPAPKKMIDWELIPYSFILDAAIYSR